MAQADHPESASEMNRAFKTAIACGALPLLTGSSIFAVWIVTRWDWLMGAGWFTLYAGLILVAVGAIALGRYRWLASLCSSKMTDRRFRLSTCACAGLLLSNFPVAAGIIVAAVAIETGYTVVVKNASQAPLDHVRVVGGGCEMDYGSILPGQAVRRTCWIQHDGELNFSASGGGTKYAVQIDGYVTNGMGGYKTVTIKPDSAISVSDQHDKQPATVLH
jgi:hypothetical protein